MMSSSMIDNITKSTDPEMVAARLFIGNLPTERCSKEDIQNHFTSYGEILGISTFKGFGFVQFSSSISAISAIQDKHAAVFMGQRLDVRLANEGRKMAVGDKRPHPPAYGGSSREFFMQESYGNADSLYVARGGERPMIRSIEDRPNNRYSMDFQSIPKPPSFFRSPTTNSSYAGTGQSPLMAFEGSSGPPGSTSQNPHHHSNANLEPIGGPNSVRKVDSGSERPFDAIVVVVDKQFKVYSEMVERRLIEINLNVDVVILIKPEMDNSILEALARKGPLYVIAVDQQHSEHKSVTVYILHGTPQEHRNMPLDDALQLLSGDFSGYLNRLRSGSEQPSLNFLLHLLADGKNLSDGELERIVEHLKQRRLTNCDINDKSASAPSSIEGTKTEPIGPVDSVKQVEKEKTSAGDLQKKIMSILSGTAVNAGKNSTVQPTNVGMGSSDVQRALQTVLSSSAIRAVLPSLPKNPPASGMSTSDTTSSINTATFTPTNQNIYGSTSTTATADTSNHPSMNVYASRQNHYQQLDGNAMQHYQQQQMHQQHMMQNQQQQMHQQQMMHSQQQQLMAQNQQQQQQHQMMQNKMHHFQHQQPQTMGLPNRQAGEYVQPSIPGGNCGLLG